jgi:hypothetical protein
MAIRSKPRKSPINDFVSMIVPDRIDEAFDRVEDYFTQHLTLSFETPEGVAGVLNELIRDHGESVRNALYALLCEENGALRPLVSGSAGTGAKTAVGFLVPVLATQFGFPSAVALLVATLVIKAVAANGEKALCEELITQRRKTARHIRSGTYPKVDPALKTLHKKKKVQKIETEGVTARSSKRSKAVEVITTSQQRISTPRNGDHPARKPSGPTAKSVAKPDDKRDVDPVVKPTKKSGTKSGAKQAAKENPA